LHPNKNHRWVRKPLMRLNSREDGR
jgi:hypothetical protein